MSLRSILGRALLVVGLASAAATAHAAVPVFEKTDTMFGATLQAKTYEFSITTPGTYIASLSDNGFLAPFDFLALAITKTGGGTMGSVIHPPSPLPASFQFLASVAGSYTAIVAGLPGLSPAPISTYGVMVVAAPVPEPEIWAMMVVGVGLVGFQLRRKMKQVDAARFA